MPDPERAAFFIVHFIALAALIRAAWVVVMGCRRAWRERRMIKAVARELDEACPATRPSPARRRHPACLECKGPTSGGWLCPACSERGD